MKKSLNGISVFALAAAVTAGLATTGGTAAPVLVTNGNDSGEGSLRAAIEAVAKTDGPALILIETDDDIEIETTLVYDSTAPLFIYGRGQTVEIDVDATLLTMSQGADLTVSDLNFEGPDNFSIQNRGKDGKGIFIDVRDDQTGIVTLTLSDVTVSGVAYHGIHISDCDLADDCGAGRGGKGGGSPASIAVQLKDVEIYDVGNGRFDADGIRVDERGEGDVFFVAEDSSFTLVGADGVELDEGQEGSVFVTAVASQFDDNGAYCDPTILDALLPEKKEGEFEDNKVAEKDIPAEVTGSPDDACFEREVELYDSGYVKAYEFGIDLDDGFDIDEAGPGDLWALIIDSSIQENLDEGLDFGEEDEGGIHLAVWRTTAKDNTDDGFKIVESEDGDVDVLLHDVVSKDNGGYGADIRQLNKGTFNARADKVRTDDNDDGDNTGLKLTNEGESEGTITISASKIEDGITAKNVKVVEE